jgi:glycosyltransferase involved in cell wall biosynthesis
MRQKILFVTPYFPRHGGGLERYALEIARRLASGHGWDVAVVTSGERGGRDAREITDGITVYRLAYDLKVSNTPFGFGWPRKIKKILEVERPDLINIHMPVPGIGDVAASVAGTTPIAVTYHAGSMRKGRFIADVVIWLYEHTFLPLLLGRADRIICSSDYVRGEFFKKYLKKSSTVTPAVDTSVFKPLEHEKPFGATVLFVAGLGKAEQHKGLRTLLKAMTLVVARVPEARLTIVGDGDMRAEYARYADELGLKGSVRFTGRLSGVPLVSEYQHAHVLVLPSTTPESFGMVLLEAMACGVAVIGSDIGGIPYLIKDGEDGLLLSAPGHRIVAEKILQILTDPALAKRLATKGLVKAQTRFSWDTQAKRYDELLQTVLTHA